MGAKTTLLAAGCVVWALSLFVAVNGVHGGDPNEMIQWSYPVAFDVRQEQDLKSRAETLSEILRIPVRWGGQEVNPVCCFWLRIEPFTPNPGQAGYVIVIQPGGAFILAADLAQMDAAIKRVGDVAKTIDGRAHLPLGLMTNYDLVMP